MNAPAWSVCSHCHSEALASVPSPLTHYVILRADLPRGIQAANCVHAAGESSPGNLPAETHAVVLTAPSEAALRAVAARLRLARVAFFEIVEVDDPWSGQLMALGLVPRPKEEVRRFVSNLPLLK